MLVLFIKRIPFMLTGVSNLVNYGKKMIQVTGPLLWNDLPPEIQDASSIFTFKVQLKNHFIEKYDEE